MIYLVAAANAMYSLLSHRPPNLNDLTTAASIGCTTLNTLVDDQEFVGYIQVLSNRRNENRRAFDSITGKPNHSIEYFHHFLTEEKRVMREAGFNSRLADECTKRANRLIHLIREWNGEPEIIFSQIAQIRDDACSMADRLNDELRQRQDGVSERNTRRQVRRILYVVAGGAIIVLNVVASLELTPAGTAVSGALGNALISQAIPSA